jgi:hypothetical protein
LGGDLVVPANGGGKMTLNGVFIYLF